MSGSAVHDLSGVERGEFRIGDAASEGFRGLFQQIDRGGAQQQKAPGVAARVRRRSAAQRHEQIGRALHFVENDELLLHGRRDRVPGRPACRDRKSDFQIEIDRGTVLGDIEGKRGFSALARSEKRHGGVAL